MTTRLIRYVAFMGLLTLPPSTSQAQAPVEATSLRVRWEAAAPAHGLQTVCGRVLNDRTVGARRVRLRVEGLDAGGGVTGRRDADLPGQVSAQGIGLFCITMSAGAASYRVTVVGVDWAAEPEAP